MNIYDVAKKAGVSIATVSRVLNGSSRVSDKTQQKVIEAMDSLGYVPNVFARSLGLNTMHMVGIMCADVSDTYLALAVYHLEQNLRLLGYDSILCCTGYDTADKHKGIDILLQKRVDAIFLVGSSYVEEEFEQNKYIIKAAKNIPILMINGKIDGENIYSFYCDDKSSTFSLTEQLLKNELKFPIFLYRRLSFSGMQKKEGFLLALKQYNIKNPENHLLACETDIEKNKSILYEFAEKQKFDAVIASEDILAIAAIKFAKSVNLKIPQEISITGYNNSLLARCCEPELTSVDNKVEDICSHATAALTMILKNENVPSSICIPTKLVKRKSTMI